jgi:cytochrome c oxidase cbb3-type subunit 3
MADQDINGTGAVADPYKDKLKDHAFDGIQEYDNNLPRWWLALFLGTVVWAIWYIPYYHGGPGKVGPDQLREDLAALTAERAKLAGAGGSAVDEAGLRTWASDPAHIEAGKTLFMQQCLPCHGPEGLGLVGPNLRDRFWICEPTMTGLIGVLEKGGRPGKGMMPYAHLGTEPIRNLAAFIVSLNRQGIRDNPIKPHGPDEQEKPLDW